MKKRKKKRPERSIWNDINPQKITIHKNEKAIYDINDMKVVEIIQMQVSRKQDTSYLDIKEDLSKF